MIGHTPLLTSSYALPFDRHDWVVDRCGQEVLYILDFYNGKPTPEKPISVFIDVRPQLSWEGVWDRIRVGFNSLFQ